jgi:glycosyltransferase involved in cell wall biosynthesis
MSKNIKILFIRKGKTRFEDFDFKILSKNFSVFDYQFSFRTLHSLLIEISRCDYVFYWFPNDYKFFISLLAKLLSKKIIVVGGGQMATADNKKNRLYAGVRYRLFYIFFARMCLKISDKVIAVSDYEKNGLLRFVKEEKIKLIYNCVDLGIFKFNEKKSSNTIITLSQLNWEYYKRKGLDTFVELAKNIREYNFIIIGKDHNDGVSKLIQNQGLKNLTLIDNVKDNELKRFFSNANIYCQLSRQEGFGVALAESIACGCVPVVSKMGSIPEVAGPNAFYIDENRNPEEIKKTMSIAEHYSTKKRRIDAERIVEMFNPSKREKILIKLMNRL